MDFNIFPVFSLLSRKRLDRMIRERFGSLTIEDLPINYFCVSSNLTQSNFEVHRSGILTKAIRASISLPGILTPVIKDKNVLVDGSIFNNLPIDVMPTQNVGTIIASSLRAEIAPMELDVLPKKSKFILNHIFKRKEKFAQLPTLMNIFMKTITANSDQKEKHLLSGADLVFNLTYQDLILWDGKTTMKLWKWVISMLKKYYEKLLKSLIKLKTLYDGSVKNNY